LTAGEQKEAPTVDTFFDGRLKVYQHRSGYRFSIDAFLLAHQPRPRKGDGRVVDFGTGCGILPLLLAYRNTEIEIWGVEIQPGLAQLARHNVRANDLGHRIQIIESDLQKISPQILGFTADLVICNPPFRRSATGRINPNRERAIARHEIVLTLDGLLRAVRRNLRTGGCFWTIYPAQRLPELIRSMQAFNIEPKLVRMVHSYKDKGAKLVLMAGVKAARPGLTVGPPLVIYGANGRYSEAVQAMFAP
jgi:tRNA1Val (adenine37-N6)-methyltransferase